MNTNENNPIYLDSTCSVDERVQDLLSRMTLEEKTLQLLSHSQRHASLVEEGAGEEVEKIEEVLACGRGAIENPGGRRTPYESAEITNHIQKSLKENTRLRIPTFINSECLHGHVGYNSTSFPMPIALGCSFDPDLVQKIFDIVGREARARGSHEAHTPVLDIGRDPRWGRSGETYGEDTYLTSRMAVAAVSGLQGGADGNPGQTHVIASAKHFAGYAQVDGGRNFAPAYITLRQFIDEILPPFKAAVIEAKGQGIMASHCEIDGIPAHGNRWLLTEILREQWGFEGIVVTDYMDISRLEILHHVAANQLEAGEMAIKAGVDLDLPLGYTYKNLPEIVRNKPEIEKYIDQAVSRVLRLKFMMDLFENSYADPDFAEKFVNNPEHRKLAKQSADKCIVLLKNENHLLPLDKTKIKKIAVIGPKAAQNDIGTYSAKNDYIVNILEGIKKKVESEVEVFYEKGCVVAVVEKGQNNKDNIRCLSYKEEEESIKKAVELAKQSDVAVICVGEERFTCKEAGFKEGILGDRSCLELLGNQEALIMKVAETGTPTIVVLLHGRPLAIPQIAEKVPAILEAFYLGQEVGSTLADVIFGDVNPGGKLSVSLPRSVGHLPIYYSQKPSAFLKDYITEKNTPLYPFGHGLSYTTFEYSDLEIAKKQIPIGEKVEIQFTAKNTGDREGDEVSQLYINDKVASVTRPVKELKRFKRVTLKPGEKTTIKFKLNAEDFAFTGIDMKPTIEAGEFDVMIGSSSEDIQLKDTFELLSS